MDSSDLFGHLNLEGKFIPIKPEEPFAYIERLKDAYLVQREERIGICIKEAGT